MSLRAVFEAKTAIEEAREKYSHLSTFAKQQAGPVLVPIMFAVDNLVYALAEQVKKMDGKQNG